jgi:hypothetical protein
MLAKIFAMIFDLQSSVDVRLFEEPLQCFALIVPTSAAAVWLAM